MRLGKWAIRLTRGQILSDQLRPRANSAGVLWRQGSCLTPVKQTLWLAVKVEILV